MAPGNQDMRESRGQLTRLSERRKTIIAQIAYYHKVISEAASPIEVHEAEIKKEKLNSLSEQFKTCIQAIENHDDYEWNADWLQENCKSEELLLKATAILRAATTPRPELETSAFNFSSVANVMQPELRLPHIDVPKFDGNYSNWQSFNELFSSLVHDNRNLDTSQKFHYLVNSLTGSAAKLIKHLPVVVANYNLAWNILIDRYQNKRAITNNYLENLIEQPKVNPGSAQGIRDMIDTTNECLFGIKTLEFNTDSWYPWVVYMLTRKLDNDSRIAWEQCVGGNKEVPSLEKFMKFLDTRFRILDEIAKTTNPRYSKEKIRAAHVETSNQNEKANECCAYCNGKHFIYFCQQFRALSVEDREQFVRNNRLCFNCLYSHLISNCKSKYTCRTCKRKHNTLLHSSAAPSPSTSMAESENENRIQQNSFTAHCTSKFKSKNTLLATALVSVGSPNGVNHILRALIDQGSQATFITRSAAQLLKLPLISANISVSGVGKSSERIKHSTTIKINSLTDTRFQITVNAFVLQKISNLRCTLPNENINWPHLDGLKLADPQFSNYEKIDILLGADVFCEIAMPGLIKGEEGAPMAQQTKLGWILSGPIHQASDEIRNFQITCNHIELTIDQQLERFWKQEEISNENVVKEDNECIEMFKNTYERDEDGRYSVEMMFKKENLTKEDLGSSRSVAVARLLQMEKRFEKDPKFKELYINFMKDYLESGHMELSEPADENELVYHLPHHGVLRESSSTTRLRAVFDASAKSSSGFSLNDWQLVGPTVQRKLTAILLRWRIYTIVFSGDVKQMYRQVKIKKKHRNLQRIVWRWKTSEPIRDHTLNTVTYGEAIAAFLAIMAMIQTVYDEAEFLKAISEELFLMILMSVLEDFYMDDYYSGAFTLQKALLKRKYVTLVLQRGCFLLRKWKSNDARILEEIPEEEREMKTINLDSEPSIKTLGVFWDPYSDEFHFKIDLSSASTKPLTKRIFLSESARLFDPFGWLAPCVVKVKILFQSLWKLKLDWDSILPEKIQNEWIDLRNQLKKCETIRIPRWFNLHENSEYSIHGFCDASKKAMAAVIYIKVGNENDRNLHVSLVMSKTKVAPIEEISVPRLELKAATLLAELTSEVIESMHKPPQKINLWSDSKAVLAWIKGDINRWKMYVSNRIKVILKHTKAENWLYVPTKENPADIASRGVAPENLIQNDMWWHGPSWVALNDKYWPEQSNYYQTKEEEKSQKEIKALNTIINPTLPKFITKYSSFIKLSRIMAHWYRFIHNSLSKIRKTKQFSGPITVHELQNTQIKLIKLVQQEYFKEEIKALENNKNISKRSSIVKLYPILDKTHDVMRVGGRLANHYGSTDKKHPLILPSDNHFTKLLVEYAHEKTLHGGISAMQQFIRQRYWIVRGKNIIKRCLHQCIRCFKHKNHIQQSPLMADLPAPRVNPSRCFEHCGVDFAGPVEVRSSLRRKAPTDKGYIAIFVCFSTKAVHLELVSSLSTQSFISAVRRMSARRGIPAHIYCDNGTNFIGAKNELPRLLKKACENQTKEIINILCNDGIQWHFNPPTAANFGGLWEAAVRSTKHHLKRIVHNTKLTFEELSTLLCQIEATLNSRPLCTISEDEDHLEILTAGHFLTGAALNSIPEPDITMIPENRLNRWQLVQRMTQHFWKRWSNEYLSTLQTRSKWYKMKENIKLGTLVLIREENLPTSRWMLARVIQIHPGNDGVVRVVTVKTKNSTMKRPVNKLCELPMD